MSALELPEQLKGPWDHALILSYGLDIPFFERALWYQFPTRCRNKIILADGQQYLQVSDAYSQQRGLVRHMNQLYVVAGIFGLHTYTSAHAKLILLTNAQQGRLLVGSGNLLVNTLRSGRIWPANVEHCPQSWTLGQTFLEKLLLIWLLSSIFCE